MLILVVAQLGIGIYGLVNYESLIERGLNETLHATKENEVLEKAWEGLQYYVSTSTHLLKGEKKSRYYNRLFFHTLCILNYRNNVAASMHHRIGCQLLGQTIHYQPHVAINQRQVQQYRSIRRKTVESKTQQKLVAKRNCLNTFD